jgi:type VI secretion system protein
MGMLSRMGFTKTGQAGQGAGAASPARPARPTGTGKPAAEHHTGAAFAYEHRPSTLEAVMENLRLVLNTKEGYGWFLPGFGLGHYFSSPPGGEAVLTLVDEITTNVRRFEPRLVDPVVTVVGRDEPCIVLVLAGRVEGRAIALEVRFHVTFGTVDIEVEDDGTR